MTLYVVRHGQTDWNALERAQGGADRPLDEVGLRQTSAIALAFTDVPVGRIWTSPLRRAADTARAVREVTGAELLTDVLLHERRFGDLEGATYAELRTFFDANGGADLSVRNRVRPPGGESFEDVWQRLVTWLPKLLSGPSRQMVVSHGGVSSLLCAMLMGQSLEDSDRYRFHNASITEMELDPPKMVRFDETVHLADIPLLKRRGDVGAR